MQSIFVATTRFPAVDDGAGVDEEEDIGSLSSFSIHSNDDLEDTAATSTSSEGHDAASFEMSSMLSELPVKKGLSIYFDGKSQSFTSLAAVQSVDDLMKAPPPAAARSPRSALRSSRSYGNGLGTHKHLLPRHSAMAFAKKSSAAAAVGVNRRRTAAPKLHTTNAAVYA